MQRRIVKRLWPILRFMQSVLVEEKNRQDPGLMTGRTSYNLVVHFPGDESLIGKIVDVRLAKSCGFYYMGERV